MPKKNLISKLLTEHGMQTSKAVRRPVQYEVDISLRPNTLSDSECKKYRSIVESLIYLATITKPDLCVVASALGCYLANPTQHQVAAAKYALHYLRGTADEKSILKPVPHDQLLACVDASWGLSQVLNIKAHPKYS